MMYKKTGFLSRFRYLFLVAVLAFGLIAIIGSNGGDDETTTTDTTPPTVSSTTPAAGAIDVSVDTIITATFSEEMDASTITTSTFTVNDGSSNIAGTVAYSDTTATFTPADNLAYDKEYTATITTGAKDSAGNALEADYTWSFTTVSGATFNSGGTIGDLLTYTLDTTNLTYSYEIVESDFGLAGTTGSGTLTQNADGTYTPSSDLNARVILLPNTFLVGGADVTVSGTDTTMIFAGVPAINTTYTSSEIAGTYSYITFECESALVGGECTGDYRSYYGTFKVDAGGTWEECDSGDIDVQPSTSDGNWADSGSGLLQITSGGTVIGNAMLLPSASGGKVIIIDLKDRPAGGAGPGILIGVKKQDITNEDLGGTYHYNGSEGSYGDVTVVNATDSYTGTDYDYQGNQTAINGTFTRNDPWNGWLIEDSGTPADTTDDSIILILPGDGIFLQTSPSDNDWINIGGQIP